MLCGWRDGTKIRETVGGVPDEESFCKVKFIYIYIYDTSNNIQFPKA